MTLLMATSVCRQGPGARNGARRNPLNNAARCGRKAPRTLRIYMDGGKPLQPGCHAEPCESGWFFHRIGARQHPMILSASYRTDIPAFHAAWFLARLQAGFVQVKSPYGAAPYRVSLA